MGARSFRDYSVWKEAVDLATHIYTITSDMPWFEKKGLCDQMQRSAVSISSNIAEGAGRVSDGEFSHFLSIALGSAFETETQLLISKNVGYISEEQYGDILKKLTSVEKQLNGLILTIRCSSN
ncbi:MAG: four helix bundle protein [Bacteroidales bacterium]|nr:four helix bundle protein [Bacteroidales bacterium]